MAEIAAAFVQHYYQTFDSNREALVALYADTSMMTFEGAQCLGVQAIGEKLKSLPFKRIVHHILTQDFQPGGNTLLIFVTGQFVVDEDVDKPFFFSQVFQLVSSGSSYYVQHDIFRRVSLT